MLAREKSENRPGPTACGCLFFSSLLTPCYAIAGTWASIGHRADPGPLQGPATLKEIKHDHHDRDDQENVKDSAHGVRGD